VKTATAIAGAHASWLRRFFVREDVAYDQYEAAYQAKSVSGKATYLFLLGVAWRARLRLYQRRTCVSSADGFHWPISEIPSVCLGPPDHLRVAYVCALPGAQTDR
jgi:hypothetical protein